MEDSSIDISYICSLPLSSLTFTTRRLLSNLLDPPKVLPSDGPIRRHRDWRGLASLVNISTEVEANISHYHDKTGRVLEEWMQSRAGTIGELLDHLTKLDRFDVYDDVIASIQEQNAYTPENERQLIPIMYKLCTLPPQLRMYHMLNYNNRMNNFWEKLIKSLDVTRYMMNGITPAPAVAAAPRQAATASSNSHSAVNIATASDTVENDSRYFLPQKPIPYIPLRSHPHRNEHHSST